MATANNKLYTYICTINRNEESSMLDASNTDQSGHPVEQESKYIVFPRPNGWVDSLLSSCIVYILIL